jgi:hypothetical protein
MVPLFSAQRIELGELEWRPTVLRLMDEARLVVIEVGDSENLMCGNFHCFPQKLGPQKLFCYLRRVGYSAAPKTASGIDGTCLS